MADAQQAGTAEICGLISQNKQQQMTLFPVQNIARDNTQFFEMDPAQMIAAIKVMRENDAELYAIYHSHPTSDALPSPTDIEKMPYQDTLYLIVSLNQKGVLELRGYKIHNNQTITVNLVI